jgi:hypothetical protein
MWFPGWLQTLTAGKPWLGAPLPLDLVPELWPKMKLFSL